MAKVLEILNVEFSSTVNDNLCGWLYTNSKELKSRIEALGYTMEERSLGPSSDLEFTCRIEEPEGSNQADLVRNAIREIGLLEHSSAILPKELRKTHFAFRKIRNFTKRDRDQAEYLRLNVKGMNRIADYSQTTTEGYLLRVNHRLKNNLDFGWLDVVIVPYVSEKGREQLKRKNFEGIHFDPAIFDQPGKAAKQLYQLTSKLTMPPCLLPIQNGYGDVVSEDCNEGERIWDDAGYVQPILKYRREEVEAMGTFDIAKTREQIGGLPQHYRHQYIVSQRFRRHLETMKVLSVDFVPVELVDSTS